MRMMFGLISLLLALFVVWSLMHQQLSTIKTKPSALTSVQTMESESVPLQPANPTNSISPMHPAQQVQQVQQVLDEVNKQQEQRLKDLE